MKRIAELLNDKGRVIGLVHGPDATNQIIRVNGRVWRFDFDKMCGPLWVKRNGNATKNQNPPKAVWDAFEKWHKKWNH